MADKTQILLRLLSRLKPRRKDTSEFMDFSTRTGPPVEHAPIRIDRNAFTSKPTRPDLLFLETPATRKKIQKLLEAPYPSKKFDKLYAELMKKTKKK